MPYNKNWFSLQIETYTQLSKAQLEKVFSGRLRLSNCFRVFLGRLYPDFLKDFASYENSIRRILKRSARRKKIKAIRKQVIGR